MSDTDTAGSFSVQAGDERCRNYECSYSTKSGTYTFAVKRASGKAVDKGTYTIRFRLKDTEQLCHTDKRFCSFVTSAADFRRSNYTCKQGTFVAGETVTMTATQSLTATLRNANGGRIQNLGAITAGPGVPTLVAGLWEGTTPAIVGATSNWYVSDTGTHVAAPGWLCRRLTSQLLQQILQLCVRIIC
jgi:hypothetical protein